MASTTKQSDIQANDGAYLHEGDEVLMSYDYESGWDKERLWYMFDIELLDADKNEFAVLGYRHNFAWGDKADIPRFMIDKLNEPNQTVKFIIAYKDIRE